MTSSALVPADKVQIQLRSLEPSAIIELFQVHLTEAVNGMDTIFHYHAGTNEIRNPIVFNNLVYDAIPCEVKGFSKTTKGTLPRPTMSIANANSGMSSLLSSLNFLQAAVCRIRTCYKFIDAVNYASGINPNADPTAVFDPPAVGSIYPSSDVWYIDRIAQENNIAVIFELSSKLDLTNLQLPSRQILEFCPWRYGGEQCRYTGQNGYFDINDGPTSKANDVCAHRYSSCVKRHPTGDLPFGGMPGCRLKL